MKEQVNNIADLFEKKNAQFVHFKAVTEPKMKKKNNPFANRDVKKVAHVYGIVNFRYENSVNNQRERENKEANFESAPRKWGKHVDGLPFIEHKGRQYLEVKREKVLYEYLVDGQPVSDKDAEELESFLYSSEPKRQQLDEVVTLRDYKLEHIHELYANKKVYKKDE